MKAYLGLIMMYMVAISLFGLFQMGYDKKQAKKGFWRVPEKTLFLTAAAGGAMGVFMGMKLFRHKTKHKSFTLGIPMLLMLNLLVVGWIAIN